MQAKWLWFADEIWYCNFEGQDGTQTICDLTLDMTTDFYWTVYSGNTPSEHTGPSSAYNGKYYIYNEATNRAQGDVGRLVTSKDPENKTSHNPENIQQPWIFNFS